MTDFMSKAHALRNAVNWNSNSSVEVIAEALRVAYEDGIDDTAQATLAAVASETDACQRRVFSAIRKLKEARS